MATIGFFGLGTMGLPMAKRLCQAGHTLLVAVHTNPAPVEEIAALGARVAASAAEVAAGADTVISIVPGDAQLRELFFDSPVSRAMRPGTLLIEMTTTAPATMRQVAAHLEQQGVAVLDAPVSGGVRGAAEGSLTIICGGDSPVHARALPILTALGAKVPLVGGIGAGKAMKAVNQLLVAVNTVAVAEGLALARKMGVDLSAMKEVVSTSSGNSAAFGNKIESMMREDFSPRFTTALMRKDLRIALDGADDIPLPLAALTGDLYAMLGPAADTCDYSCIATLYRPGAKTR